MSKRSPYGPYVDDRTIPEVEELRTFINSLTEEEMKAMDEEWSDEEWMKFQGQYHGPNALENLKKKSVEVLNGLKEDLTLYREKVEFDKTHTSITLLKRFEKLSEHWQQYVYTKLTYGFENDNDLEYTNIDLSRIEPSSEKPLDIIFAMFGLLDGQLKNMDLYDQLKRFKLLRRFHQLITEVE